MILADLDLTEIPVVVEYACGHVGAQMMTSEELNTTPFEYADGVLTVPTDCAACLDIVEHDGAQGDELPFEDDGEDQFAGVFEPFPPEDSPVYLVLH